MQNMTDITALSLRRKIGYTTENMFAEKENKNSDLEAFPKRYDDTRGCV